MFLVSMMFAVGMVLQTPQIPVFEGRDLPRVGGPLKPYWPDPAKGFPTTVSQYQIRQHARTGVGVPCVEVPPGDCQIRDSIKDVAGWKAYKVKVEGGAQLHVRLTGLHEAWFMVKVVNRWGREEEGMLRNRIPTGNPEAFYSNPSKETREVYFVVDSSEVDVREETFVLSFKAIAGGPKR